METADDPLALRSATAPRCDSTTSPSSSVPLEPNSACSPSTCAPPKPSSTSPSECVIFEPRSTLVTNDSDSDASSECGTTFEDDCLDDVSLSCTSIDDNSVSSRAFERKQKCLQQLLSKVDMLLHRSQAGIPNELDWMCDSSDGSSPSICSTVHSPCSLILREPLNDISEESTLCVVSLGQISSSQLSLVQETSSQEDSPNVNFQNAVQQFMNKCRVNLSLSSCSRTSSCSTASSTLSDLGLFDTSALDTCVVKETHPFRRKQSEQQIDEMLTTVRNTHASKLLSMAHRKRLAIRSWDPQSWRRYYENEEDSSEDEDSDSECSEEDGLNTRLKK